MGIRDAGVALSLGVFSLLKGGRDACELVRKGNPCLPGGEAG